MALCPHCGVDKPVAVERCWSCNQRTELGDQLWEEAARYAVCIVIFAVLFVLAKCTGA